MKRVFLTFVLCLFCHHACAWYIPASEWDAAMASYEEEIKERAQLFQREIEEMTALAENGDPVQQFKIGFKYRFLLRDDLHKEIPDHREKAAAWFRKAAEQGHVLSQLFLADFYRDIKPSPANRDEGAKWYFKAMEQELDMDNLERAYGGLAGLYVHNHDFDEALKWIEILADMKEIPAYQYQINTYYFWLECIKVQCDFLNRWQALDLLQKVADKGEIGGAKYCLGMLYKEGFFVPQNYAKAAELFTETLDSSGDILSRTAATEELSLLYEQGFGVKADHVVAHALLRKVNWTYSKYAKNDDRKLRKLAVGMTHEELAASKNLSEKMEQGEISRTLNAHLSRKKSFH